MTKKWILFDQMGVLFVDSDDVSACLIPYLRKAGVLHSDEEIRKMYILASEGKITSTEFWNTFGLNNVDRHYLGKKLMFDPMSGEVQKTFGDAFNYGIISNDIAEWSQITREMYPFGEYVSEYIISGELGIRQPNMALFEAFLNRTKANPEDCIFIDDAMANIQAARRVGMKGIHFTRGSQPLVCVEECEARVVGWPALLEAIKGLQAVLK